MEYQGIIFDFNGTLFFDNDKHVKAWNEISKILRGKEITLEELHTKLNGTPNIQNILYFTDGKATKEELEKYSQKKEEYYRQFCKEDTEKFHLVDGVCEFFDHLKEKDIHLRLLVHQSKKILISLLSPLDWTAGSSQKISFMMMEHMRIRSQCFIKQPM